LCAPVILAIQEVEAGGSQLTGQPGKSVRPYVQTLVLKNKNKIKTKALGVYLKW
jgi:hypothetical protein